MDTFIENDLSEQEVDITSNIDFQLNKYNDLEYFSKKQIPEKALFAPKLFVSKLSKFYESNLDIPLLIYGVKGCGKLTAILGLMNNVPVYFPEIEDKYDSRKTNNIYYMKILDKEYEKLLVYENLYYLNIDILSNSNEIIMYIKHIYKISKGRSIDGNIKIIVISSIEKCNIEAQKYINFILDKLNGNTSYIFTTTKLNNINTKIKSSCARINFGHLNEMEFTKIFTFNYKSIFPQKHFISNYLKNYYEIYINNHYNIGHTISQIKYIIDTTDITIDKLQADEYKQSLMYNIVKNFIKKKLKLSTINTALDIRKFLYTLLSLNIDLLEFCKILVKQLISRKINNTTKRLIIEKASILSSEFTLINKEVISVESFIYNIIHIIYSGGHE